MFVLFFILYVRMDECRSREIEAWLLGPISQQRKASNQKVSNDRKLRISESLKVGDPICGKVLGIHNVADPVALYREVLEGF